MFLYVLAKIRVFSPYCFPLGFFSNRIVPEASNSESCSNFSDSTEGIKAHHFGSDRRKNGNFFPKFELHRNVYFGYVLKDK